MKFKRYSDHCYAVVKGTRRGPVAHDKVTAVARYKASGLIAPANKDNTGRPKNIAARIMAFQARGKSFNISWAAGVRMAAALMRQYRKGGHALHR
jgi:hypothetical protein